MTDWFTELRKIVVSRCTASARRVLPVFAIVVGLILSQSSAASAAVVGLQSTGSASYPNGGLSFIGDMNTSGDLSSGTVGNGIYSFGFDSTTGYALTGSIGTSSTVGGFTDGTHGTSFLTKVKLGAGGALPTVVGHTTTYHDGLGSITGATSMVIDSGSGLTNLSNHYAYVGTTSGKLLKVQLNPPDASYPSGDPAAAPKVLAVYSPGGTLYASAIDQTYAYFVGYNGTTITRMKLSDNSFTTISGLPSLGYYRANLVNNNLYLDSISPNAAIVDVNLANVSGGTISSYTSIPVASAPGAFVVDPTQAYAYTGTSSPSNQVLNPNGSTSTSVSSAFTKTNLSTGVVGSPVSFALPSIVPANQNDHSNLALATIDPDSHAIIIGTDNNLPGEIVKFASGGNSDASPALLGTLSTPYDPATYSPPNNTFPFRVGDVNMRNVAIDPKAGYVYFATDTNVPHIFQVQYSQKGSIKGDKVTLPAGAALTSVNFYCNTPVSPSASSSGNVRLAVYQDSGGMPGSLIWQSGDVADNVASNGGWLSVSSGLPTITSAGNYWLAWQVDSTLDIPGYAQGTPANGFTFNQAYGAFPASLSASGGTPTLTSDLWSMNVQYALISSGSAVWTSTSGSLWSADANWTDVGGTAKAAPGLSSSRSDVDRAVFDGTGTALTISLSGVAPSLKSLTFSNSNYTLTGGSLTVRSYSGTASVSVDSGAQFIDGSVTTVLTSNVAIVAKQGSSLTIAGDIHGSGALSLTDAGMLVLSGSNTYSGGTNVETGTLELTSAGGLPDGSSLTVGAGATLIFNPSSQGTPITGGAQAVPEPSAFALFSVGVVGLVRYRCRTRTRTSY